MPTLLAQNLNQGTAKCGTCLGREPKTKPWHGFEVLGLTLTWVHLPFPDKSGPTKARRRCFIDRIGKLRSHKSPLHLYEDAMHPTADYKTNSSVAGYFQSCKGCAPTRAKLVLTRYLAVNAHAIWRRLLATFHPIITTNSCHS